MYIGSVNVGYVGRLSMAISQVESIGEIVVSETDVCQEVCIVGRVYKTLHCVSAMDTVEMVAILWAIWSISNDVLTRYLMYRYKDRSTEMGCLSHRTGIGDTEGLQYIVDRVGVG